MHAEELSGLTESSRWREASRSFQRFSRSRASMTRSLTSTLGKALGGAAGGFVAGTASLCDTLTQRSRPQLFSNALPPTVAASALAAVRHVEQRSEERRVGKECRSRWSPEH